MTPAQTANHLKKLLASFFSARSITLDGDGLRMWLDAFSDLTPEAIELALRRFNRECTDHPTPAAVRRYSGAAGLTDEQRAQAGWRVVRSTILKYGSYYAIEFDDVIIHAAISAIGGWVNLCNTPHDEMTWKAKAFVEAYVSVARSGLGDFQRLPGLSNNQPEKIEITTGLLPHVGLKALETTAGGRIARLPNLSIDREVSR